MTPTFHRLAVFDRGTPAVRMIQAAREVDHAAAARGERGIRSIALHTPAERGARFAREADEAVALDAPHRDGIDRDTVARALREVRADALWSGSRSLARLGELAELCSALGVTFVGPAVAMLRRLGDAATVAEAAARTGVQLCEPDGAADPGPARVFEIALLRDPAGVTWALGPYDVSLQRHGRCLLAEMPPLALAPDLARQLRDAARALGVALDLHGSATCEFRVEPAARTFALRRLRAGVSRASVVVEAVSGVDLVKLELRLASGAALDPAPPANMAAHAAATAIAALDPERDLGPAPGAVERLRLPTGAGLRVDVGYAEGEVLPPGGDTVLVSVLASGSDRGESFARLRRALVETTVVLRPGRSDLALLLAILDREEIREGRADERWLDRVIAGGEHRSREHADVALLRAAIDAYDTEHAVERRQFFASAARGRPRVGHDFGTSAELRHRGRTYRLSVACLDSGRYRISLDDSVALVRLDRIDRFEAWLHWGGRRFRVLSTPEGPDSLVEVEGARHRIARTDGGLVRAPSPAVVLEIPVAVGDTVAAGERVVVLEAMKMEMPVLAPFAGRVRAILVPANVHVDTGAPLLLLDALEGVVEPPAAQAIVLAREEVAQEGAALDLRVQAVLRGLRQQVLGFDVDAVAAKRLLAEYRELVRLVPAEHPGLREDEDETLATFADLAAVFRRPPTHDNSDDGDMIRSEEYAFTYARSLDTRGEGLPPSFLEKLRRALAHYGVVHLDPTPELEDALLRVFKARERADEHAAAVTAILERRLARAESLRGSADPAWRDLLERVIAVADGRHQAIAELAREIRYRDFDQPLFEAARRRVYDDVDENLARLARDGQGVDRQARIEALVACPLPLVALLAPRFRSADLPLRQLMLEVLTRRYYRIRDLEWLECHALDGHGCAAAEYEFEGRRIRAIATSAAWTEMSSTLAALRGAVAAVPAEVDVVIDLYLLREGSLGDADAVEPELRAVLDQADLGRRIRRLVVIVAGDGDRAGPTQYFTYRPRDGGGFTEERLYRGLHPMMGKRMHLWRLANFEIERLPSIEDVYLFHAVARENPKDERLFAIAEVRDLTPVRDAGGRLASFPYLERMLMEALAGIRAFQAARPPQEQLPWNRVLLFVRPPLLLEPEELQRAIRRLAPATAGLGIEQVVVRCRMPSQEDGELRDTVLRVSNPSGSGLRVTTGPPPQTPLRPLSAYDQKVLRMRQRGLVYPYELLAMLTSQPDGDRKAVPPGEFVEYDLDREGRLVPVARAPGLNQSNVVAGVIRSFTTRFPEGMARVVLLGDPSRAMGALAEPECRRINAAIDLAQEMGVPLEWFALSAGAKISMESGTENMDWIAAVLRRIIEFTQGGGEINVVVNGINVGAQPYWNAEATMLLHTRGILVMTPLGAMVLTGKQALDYSGSVSAEDNLGIGGYERVMGPNGQAQYWARDVGDALRILLRHYDLTYVAPGEPFPRSLPTADPHDRDIRPYPHGGEGQAAFACVGDIFSREHNGDRKRPFAIRRVMHAVIDQDQPPLERWTDMRDAEIAVIWDAQLGGRPVCLIGIESRPLRRAGFLPADGPDHWTAGTLFPRASKKIARALNAASANRPVVVLANLSGFDGSPESMRNLQLEYGAEIGRAVVNFRGSIVFCVVSRYHGGAYVVFSKQLNPNVEAAAIEGSYASVIGGAPAAAVVFAGEVQSRTRSDPRLRELEGQIAAADSGEQRAILRARLETLRKQVHAEKLGEVADEFDQVHSVQRALQVGSLDAILPPQRLRPYLIEAVERGMRRAAAGGG